MSEEDSALERAKSKIKADYYTQQPRTDALTEEERFAIGVYGKRPVVDYYTGRIRWVSK